MFTNEKKSKSTVLLVSVSVVCLIFIGFFLLTDGGDDADKKPGSQVGHMQDLTRKVQGMESAVKKKEGEMNALVDRYREKAGVGKSGGLNFMELSPQERRVLEEEIGREKDVSTRSLLQAILKKKDEIAELKDRIDEIERSLPAPHVAQKGESHYQIALAFLVNEKGLDREQAQKILGRTALFEELAEGFKVWNFFNGREYGTSVTQGSARVSPNVFVHRARKKLVDERDEAVSQRDRLALDVKGLEEKQVETSGRLYQTTLEKEELKTRVEDLDKRVNSMFYRLDSQKNLKKTGILKSRFLAASRLKDVAPDKFDKSLDLGLDNQLVISAKDLGVRDINDVVLYPRFYKKGHSYKVLITTNKKMALLTFKDVEKFKSERVVIAVK